MDRTEQRQTPITTEGNEMQVATPIESNQVFGHEKEKPRPFQKPGRGGHPQKLHQSPGGDVPKWYD